MYINPFLAGVLTTLIIEVVLILGAAIYTAVKRVQNSEQ